MERKNIFENTAEILKKTKNPNLKNWKKLLNELKNLVAENGDAFLIILKLRKKLAKILETEISKNEKIEIQNIFIKLTAIKKNAII